jgi:hypothetical protein
MITDGIIRAGPVAGLPKATGPDVFLNPAQATVVIGSGVYSLSPFMNERSGGGILSVSHCNKNGSCHGISCRHLATRYIRAMTGAGSYPAGSNGGEVCRAIAALGDLEPIRTQAQHYAVLAGPTRLTLLT